MNRVYFFILGFVILLAGYVSAGLVWRAQDRLDASLPANAPLALADSRKETQQLEMIEGKTGLMFDRWTNSLTGLFHGRNLAKTLVVLSSAAAIGCFIFGSLRPVRRPAPPSTEA